MRYVKSTYVDFVQRRCTTCGTVVFDGYTSKTCTKNIERQRRTMSKISATIAFHENMEATTGQSEFYGTLKIKHD